MEATQDAMRKFATIRSFDNREGAVRGDEKLLEPTLRSVTEATLGLNSLGRPG